MPDGFADQIIALLPNLRRYGISLCRSADIAEDLVQTTVVRAFAARAQWDPATRIDGWLFRILRNAWIDMVRRNKTQGVSVDIDDMPEAAQIDGRNVTEARLMLGSVQEAMEKLPADQREVMVLICVEEMSYAEAASLIGVPIGTVMSRLSRARLGISRMLGIT
jgi:RNA polymerase sigma-70 factor, ECF subfamily